MDTFLGFNRSDGSAGTRNFIAVIPTVFCANEVAAEIAGGFPLCRPLLHSKGCGQLKPDLRIITRTLIGLGINPNVGGVLLVGLGCEAVDIEEVYGSIRERGRIAEKIVIHQEGGMDRTVRAGRERVERLLEKIGKEARTPQGMENIRLGVKCGSSDATSGIAANPAAGKAVDLLLEKGGTVFFGETTEFIGAEHILARRGDGEAVRKSILDIVARMEERVRQVGVDLRGTQPSPGNIAGGLTTIEEKSLGAISKSGSHPITGVLEYGEGTERRGLFIMDSPGKEDDFLTGVAAAGANVIVFTSGGGAPQGFPLVPVIKVASNPEKVGPMAQHIDVDASAIIEGKGSIPEVGRSIIERILRVASGEVVAAEKNRYDRTIGICTLGPTV
jgi:altronate dehydratase large subunit